MVVRRQPLVLKCFSKFHKVFLIYFILPFTFLTQHAGAQIIVTLHHPPYTHLTIEDLWKLTLVNTSNITYTVYLKGEIKNSQGSIVTGVSRDFDLHPGTRNFTSQNYSEISPTINFQATNPQFEESVIRSGGFPPGEYEICIQVIEKNGENELGSQCIEALRDCSPPSLIFPDDNSEVTLVNPTFMWTTVVGVQAVSYSFKLVEINANQSPYEAVADNNSFFSQTVGQVNFTYPLQAPKLELGKRYAWQVQAVDKYGNPICSNNASNEVWSFRFNKVIGIRLLAKTFVQTGDVITFRAEVDLIDDGQNFKYIFDFGDNSQTSAQLQNIAKHSFTNPGNYSAGVKLLSIDNQVIASSDKLTINVEAKGLNLPVLLTISPTEVVGNKEVNFKLDFQGGYKNPRYRFYYGTGLSPSNWLETPESNYRYDKPGTYDVYGEVGSFDGESINSIVRSETKSVKVHPPIEVKIFAKSSVHINEEVTFKAKVTPGIGNQDFKYIFNFGDNSQTSAQLQNIAKHSFSDLGNYRANVNLVSSAGLLIADSDTLNLSVVNSTSSSSVLLIVNPTKVITDEKVNFKVELNIAEQNVKYRFHYGTGLQNSQWLDTPESEYRYQKPGTYDVYAEVGKFDGNSFSSSVSSDKKSLTVRPSINIKLIANDSTETGKEITFKAEATTNIENPDFLYVFDFGDSDYTVPQKENTAVHIYNTKGKYNAIVKLLDSQGNLLNAKGHFINVSDHYGTNTNGYQNVNNNNNNKSNKILELFLYILIVLVVILGGSLMIKYLIGPKIKLTAHWEDGRQSIVKEKDTLIDLTIRINHNIKDSKIQLNTLDKKIVNNIKRGK